MWSASMPLLAMCLDLKNVSVTATKLMSTFYKAVQALPGPSNLCIMPQTQKRPSDHLAFLAQGIASVQQAALAPRGLLAVPV